MSRTPSRSIDPNLKDGARVRKDGYPDTGTVVSDSHVDAGVVLVRWDSTGQGFSLTSELYVVRDDLQAITVELQIAPDTWRRAVTHAERATPVRAAEHPETMREAVARTLRHLAREIEAGRPTGAIQLYGITVGHVASAALRKGGE